MISSESNCWDLFKIDAARSPEEKTVISQFGKFVDEELNPLIRECHQVGRFPNELLPSLRKLGLLEMLASDSLDPIVYGLALREIERGSSAIRSFVSVQGSLVMSSIKLFGSDDQKKQWLPALGALEKIGCFGLTEPDFGSNPAAMRSRAEKESGGYRLTGTKCWITNGTQADVAVIWARLEDKVRGFLVETDRKGFEARSIQNKWSFRASDTAELFLDNVSIPESNLLPESRSLGSPLKCLNQARYGIAWGVIGAARACLQETVNHVCHRIQFKDRPLASHQLIQNKIAWMATEITAMELIAQQLGELKRKNELEPFQVSLAKMNNCRKALETARTCRELLGAAGIHDEHHVGRHLVDLETVVTYEGTEHIHSLILGEKITGIAAYA